jgi:hypothetical protein
MATQSYSRIRDVGELYIRILDFCIEFCPENRLNFMPLAPYWQAVTRVRQSGLAEKAREN